MNANPSRGQQKTKLSDQVRWAIRAEDDSTRTEEAHFRWIKCFILFHKRLYTLLPFTILRLLQSFHVYLPFALDIKYPNELKDCGWQYVFPVSITLIGPHCRDRFRHHVAEEIQPKAVESTVQQAGIAKPGFCHAVRHHATHLLRSGYNNRTLQHLPGGFGVNTTLICTRVLNKAGKRVAGPLDELGPPPARLGCRLGS